MENPSLFNLNDFINFFLNYGYLSVFLVLILCGFGLPVPEDITLVAGGVISSLACSAEGSFSNAVQSCHEVHLMFLVGILGVLIGDSSVYWLGRISGQRLIKARFFSKLLTPQRVQWIEGKFQKYGLFFVFVARFMPGLRTPIFAVCGMTRRVSFLKFFLVDSFAALISVPAWVYLGFWGERRFGTTGELEYFIKKTQYGAFIVILIFFMIIFFSWFIKKKIKEKTGIV